MKPRILLLRWFLEGKVWLRNPSMGGGDAVGAEPAAPPWRVPAIFVVFCGLRLLFTLLLSCLVP